MQSSKLESKRIFLIASENAALVDRCRSVIEEHISAATIFSAADGAEALFKIDNVLPHVAIIDPNLSKFDGFEVTDRILEMNSMCNVSVILMSAIPENERYVNQVISKQVQFLENFEDVNQLSICLTRALNRLSTDENSNYRLHFLAPGQVLFEEGEKTTSIFYVKRGDLEVIQITENGPKIIGKVEKSEFVGEMAHFNGEPRSATIRALSDCELIEIPSKALDLVLFSKPNWAKALIATLSKRLKRSNTQNFKTS